MKKPAKRYGGDKRIRDQLARHSCPTPFHKVRTQFLGNIATPRLEASPMQVIKDLWGGELPEFEDIDEANILFQELLSLWNHLTQHQSRSVPFRLVREMIRPTKEDVTRFCRMRCEELEGFLDGLFGSEESVDLPERAAAGMDRLGEIWTMNHGALQLLENPAQSPLERKLAPAGTSAAMTRSSSMVSRLTLLPLAPRLATAGMDSVPSSMPLGLTLGRLFTPLSAATSARSSAIACFRAAFSASSRSARASSSPRGRPERGIFSEANMHE